MSGPVRQQGRPDGVPFAQVPPLPTSARQRIEAEHSRLVVASVVAVMTAIGAFVAAVGVASVDSTQAQAPQRVMLGDVTALVSSERPTIQVVVLALLGVVVVAAVAVGLEAVAALMALNPRRVEMQRRRVPLPPAGPGPVVITVLIPAHNEQDGLAATLAGLLTQSRPPDRVIVVADNCTDATADIARAAGVQVFETVGNVHRKAGALNQALKRHLPVMGRGDAVMVMDADTVLDPRFIEVAAGLLEADPVLSAVGGIFYGEPGHGLLGQFQRNEYTRYALQLRARQGRVFVLTGTATLFRAEALLDVAAARGLYLPGDAGCVYDTEAITEDNELTLALKSLGATMISPQRCRVTTELMPTWRNLRRQRLRWQRGALENIATYGLTPATLRYWGQQLGLGYGTIALSLAVLLLALTVLAVDEWIWFPFWIVAGSVFVIERVGTVWAGGIRARLLAALVFPEIAYDLFLQSVFLASLINITLGRRKSWGHVTRPAHR